MDQYLNINLFWALLCILALVVSLGLNASGAPGNWIMLIVASFYACLMPNESPYDFGLVVLGLVLVIAIIGEILEFITSIMTLLPGDVILTGTPEGVSKIEPGDEIKIEIETLGSLINLVE